MKKTISLICLFFALQVSGQVLPEGVFYFINDGEKLFVRTGPLTCDYYVKDINFKRVGLDEIEQLIPMIADTTSLLNEHRPWISSYIETIPRGVVCARYIEKIIDPSFSALNIKEADKENKLTEMDLKEIEVLYEHSWQKVKHLSKRKIRRAWKLSPPLADSKFIWSDE